VVEVFGLGWLDSDRSWYYIDMELCSETLADRIHGDAADDRNLTRQQGVSVGPPLMQGTVEAVSTKSPPADPNPSVANGQDKPEENIDWASLFKIFEDVLNGLAYIHGTGTVHRDLKPHNSIAFYTHTHAHHSSVFICSKLLENWRFRYSLECNIKATAHDPLFTRDHRIQGARTSRQRQPAVQ